MSSMRARSPSGDRHGRLWFPTGAGGTDRRGDHPFPTDLTRVLLVAFDQPARDHLTAALHA